MKAFYYLAYFYLVQLIILSLWNKEQLDLHRGQNCSVSDFTEEVHFYGKELLQNLVTQLFCLFVLFFLCFGQRSLSPFFFFLFSFIFYWKAGNKLLHYDLSGAFSIGTLMVGYLSFCWEEIDFLSLLLGKPCFHLFHWLNVLIM